MLVQSYRLFPNAYFHSNVWLVFGIINFYLRVNHCHNCHNHRLFFPVRWIYVSLVTLYQKTEVTSIGHLIAHFNYSPINTNTPSNSTKIISKLYNIITIFVWIVSSRHPKLFCTNYIAHVWKIPSNMIL